MTKTLLLCASVAALALGASSLATAKTPKSSAPASSDTAAPASTAAPATTPATPATPASGAASTGASSDTSASASAALAVGMSVKDNAGAEIGKVVELKADASGTQMATIQMGTDKFAVAAASINVQNGAGVINLSKADLQSKLHPSH